MNKKEAIEGINDKLKDLKSYAKEMGEVLKSAKYFIDELEKQVKKVEQKPKAYHVTDEYSFNCLMKELDKQGYVWRSADKTTDLGAWHNVIIYLHDDKKIAHGSKREYDIREYKNYDLVEYKKEPPNFLCED